MKALLAVLQERLTRVFFAVSIETTRENSLCVTPSEEQQRPAFASNSGQTGSRTGDRHPCLEAKQHEQRSSTSRYETSGA